MLSETQILARLLAAAACGVVMGLNRKSHGKSAGMRTFSLVTLSTALATLTALLAMSADAAAPSRVVQGLVTGIGFLGAGLIIRRPDGHGIAGLTTAAAIWLAACIGIACGFGLYLLAVVTVALSLFVLIAGRPVERMFARRFGRHGRRAADRPDPGGEGGRGP